LNCSGASDMETLLVVLMVITRYDLVRLFLSQ